MKNSFKDLTYEELLIKRDELEKKYREMRFDAVMGHIENPLEKRTLRRQISRLHTIIHEYALSIRE